MNPYHQRYSQVLIDRIYRDLGRARDRGLSMTDAAWKISDDTGHSVGSILTLWSQKCRPEYLRTRQIIGPHTIRITAPDPRL